MSASSSVEPGAEVEKSEETPDFRCARRSLGLFTASVLSAVGPDFSSRKKDSHEKRIYLDSDRVKPFCSNVLRTFSNRRSCSSTVSANTTMSSVKFF